MRPTGWIAEDYSFVLGLYLGDGCISAARRTFRMRISLDARHPRVIDDAQAVLERGFVGNRIGRVRADDGATVVLSVYSSHLPCLLPQHGPGQKHQRTIALEPWQRDLVRSAPFQFLRGCIWSDGCMFINRTGPYEYLTADFCNSSADIRTLFTSACEEAGLDYRANRDRVRINRRPSVRRLVAEIGTKG
jgi:hypothetical protein